MTTLDDRLDYIQASFVFLAYETYYYVRSWCKKALPQRPEPEESEPIPEIDPATLFIYSCKDGTLPVVESLVKKHDDLDKNKGLLLAAAQGHADIAEFLIEQGATNLDRALEVACKANRMSTSELLVKKGANTAVGIRASTSMNITRMLYRYENGEENIRC